MLMYLVKIYKTDTNEEFGKYEFYNRNEANEFHSESNNTFNKESLPFVTKDIQMIQKNTVGNYEDCTQALYDLYSKIRKNILLL